MSTEDGGFTTREKPGELSFPISPIYTYMLQRLNHRPRTRVAGEVKSNQACPPARILNRDCNIPTWNVVFESVLQPPDAQSHTRLCLLFYCPPSEL